MEQTIEIDLDMLTAEITQLLETAQTVTLATCADNRVTARSMAIVNDGLNILFQTGGGSDKVRQMRINANIAFAVNNMQIEAVARITDNPGELETFLNKFKVKYPGYYATYTHLPGQVTAICEPVRFQLYKFIDGKPSADILDVKEGKAYREILM